MLYFFGDMVSDVDSRWRHIRRVIYFTPSIFTILVYPHAQYIPHKLPHLFLTSTSNAH